MWAQTNDCTTNDWTRITGSSADGGFPVEASTSQQETVGSTRGENASSVGSTALLFPECSSKGVQHSSGDNPECTGPPFSNFEEVSFHPYVYGVRHVYPVPQFSLEVVMNVVSKVWLFP